MTLAVLLFGKSNQNMYIGVIKINIRNLINYMYDFNDKEVPFISYTYKMRQQRIRFLLQGF
jgi:hypothetical protein